MKKYIISSSLMFCCFVFYCSAQTSTEESTTNKLVWHTSMEEANMLSQTSHKPIFALFTGSDWCIWCKKLDADVFSKQEFIDWANKNVILLYLDFPRHTQLSSELTQQNNGLAQALKISGYPTVWLLYANKDGTTNRINLSTLGSLGYPQYAEPGKEQLKFLSDANTILVNAKVNKP